MTIEGKGEAPLWRHYTTSLECFISSAQFASCTTSFRKHDITKLPRRFGWKTTSSEYVRRLSRPPYDVVWGKRYHEITRKLLVYFEFDPVHLPDSTQAHSVTTSPHNLQLVPPSLSPSLSLSLSLSLWNANSNEKRVFLGFRNGEATARPYFYGDGPVLISCTRVALDS